MATTAATNAALDLQEEVDRALWELDLVRTAGGRVRARVTAGGRVELAGPVRSRLTRPQVQATVRSVPGVVEVVDMMVADPDVEVAVAAALQSDPRTGGVPAGSVLVRSLFGGVTLTGRLPAGTDREAVVQVAAGVPGVQQVHDRLT
ncbi:MAG: BON domain-containing protein [Anaerolineales bacterium]